MDSIVTWHDAPAEYVNRIKMMQSKIIEIACDFSDELVKKFLNEEDIYVSKIKVALCKELAIASLH
jgi:translation elongation factor EF-G